MENTTLTLIQTLLDLGLSAILLYFLFVVWNDKKESDKNGREDRKDKDAVIDKKDAQYKELAEKVLESFNKNTESTVKLEGTMGDLKTVVERNTNVVEKNTTLTQRVFDILTIKASHDNIK